MEDPRDDDARQVEQKITSDTEAAGRTVRASDDDPQYLVKSDKSGREAVHKPEALHKDSSMTTARSAATGVARHADAGKRPPTPPRTPASRRWTAGRSASC